MPFSTLGLIFFMAGLGALLRYFLAEQFNSETFPYGIFLANILGSLFVGIFYSLSSNHPFLSPHIKLALTVGFMGALTTFSTYTLDILTMIEKQRLVVAGLYLFSSHLVALLACWSGIRFGKILAI